MRACGERVVSAAPLLWTAAATPPLFYTV